ncbi:MAG: hemerythrin domain-containing protein [Alphaproteobacteria bacterium]|nr:hemerythrin domain-containing protein [Alphaproteobacteria bacterium]
MAERNDPDETSYSERARRTGAFGAETNGAFDTWRDSGVGAIVGAAAAGFVAGLAASMVRKVAVESVTAVQGDWLDALKAEHRAVEALFHQVHATTPRDTGKRAALLKQLTAALQKHAHEEENVIYPELRMHDDGARARQLGADHGDMKTYLHELDQMRKDDPRWIQMLRALQELVLQHVREEEQDVLPQLRDRLSRADNKRLTMLLHKEGMKLA